MTNLFISYYKATTPERQAEIDYCLKKNYENPLINRVCILTSDMGVPKDFIPYKTEIINHNGRPTYSDFIKWANKFSSEKSINIISNADIIFDETLSHLDKLKENDCWALSRWEMPLLKQEQIYGDSQDCWIFRGKIKELDKADFPMGKMGCDNRIAYEIKKAGYNISNPSLTVNTWHVHNTNVRGYDPNVRNENTVVSQPYLNVPVITL